MAAATCLIPRTEAELAGMIRDARGRLAVTGGGTRGFASDGEVLSTQGLSAISLYEPGALTLVAGAGTPVAHVATVLAGEGQRLAFEVPDLRAVLGRAGQSTLGGVVAANASGPRRVQAGACRDHLLGVRFVDGTGAIAANGGRVMKNVTGYDLVRLMAGSRGSLGVLTEVAFKVLPLPETEATLRIDVADAAAAVAAMSAALASPFDVTGAAHWPGQGTFIRVEGFAGSVAYRARRLQALLAPFGTVDTDADGPARWRAIRDVTPLAGGAGDVWCVHLRPSGAAALLDSAGAALTDGDGAALLDWGGGRIWLRVAAGCDLRARLAGLGGHATRLRGNAADGIAALPPEDPAVEALAAGLRRAFDPRGLFSGPVRTEPSR